MSDMSFSNALSKGSVYESDSILKAYKGDAASRLAAGGEPEAISNERIQKGDVFLETYTVTSDAIHGGMGSVWRVHHLGWGTDLAMKRPRPRFFAEAGEGRKEAFVAECEYWINLGLHPNIVSCYYVREIGGVPSIFSEWMDGGSLKDRIADGSLYAGAEEEARERILNIAIRTAQGLKYAHGQGLIHQDVKPGNILLTGDWEAKVADFGLAKARSGLRGGRGPAPTGYTPAYCPREQAEGAAAEPWMDVYAWAATVLELFLRGRRWEEGRDAPSFLEAAELPPELADCLGGCLRKEIRDFDAVLERLYPFYAGLTGHPCAQEAGAAPDNADSLNNRALSFMDLGLPEAAKALWEQAEKKGRTPESGYNYTLFCWYRGEAMLKAVRSAIDACEEEDREEGRALRSAFESASGDFDRFLMERAIRRRRTRSGDAEYRARLEAVRGKGAGRGAGRGKGRETPLKEELATAYSADGRYAAAAVRRFLLRNRLTVYDLERGRRCFARSLGFAEWMNERAFTFSAHHRYLLACVLDAIQVYDVATGKRIARRFMQGEVLDILPWEDDRLALCVMKDGGVRAFDIEDGRTLPMADGGTAGERAPATLPPRDPATGRMYALYTGAPDSFLKPRWAVSRVVRSEEILRREERFRGLIADAERQFREKRYAQAWDTLERARSIKTKKYAPECKRLLSWFSQVWEKRGLAERVYLGTREDGPRDSMFQAGRGSAGFSRMVKNIREIVEESNEELLYFMADGYLELKAGKYRLYDGDGRLVRNTFRMRGPRRRWDTMFNSDLIADPYGLRDPKDDAYALRWQYPEYIARLTPRRFKKLGIRVTVDPWRGICGAHVKYYKPEQGSPRAAGREPLLIFSTKDGSLLAEIDLNRALSIDLNQVYGGGWLMNGGTLHRIRDLFDRGEAPLTVGLPRNGDCSLERCMTRLRVENRYTGSKEEYLLEWEYDPAGEAGSANDRP